jgi:6-pyruvoyltetrahydropterin/6-carboxytetrahydropterin synthase
MSARVRQYVLKVHGEFAAAHVLHGYPGACERIHGHTWKVEAEVVAHELDAIGMAIDFHELHRALGNILADLDHRLLNDVPPFTDMNPTAEHVAAYVYGRLGHQLQALPPPHVRLRAITVRENDRSAVTYSES